ncbi:MAG: amidohydrolase family protein [Alphaproteobacteria bacterium]|nr:amidohydrolase family protein [Alphaproteobacteria bacterium]
MTLDLIVRHAGLPDERTGVDIAVAGGRIAEVAPKIAGKAATEIDAGARLVSPRFVDAHFHLDAALTLGLAGKVNRSGTLAEGIRLWGELQPHLTADGLKGRALAYCDLAVSQGLLAIRSHVDVGDDALTAVEVLVDVKRQVAPWLDPWYPLGRADMLDVAHMGAHAGHLTGQDGTCACFAAVTATAARIMGLEGYGIEKGCHADFVLLQAKDPVEAIRLRPPRLAVVRRGRVVAEMPAQVSRLALDGRPRALDPSRRPSIRLATITTARCRRTDRPAPGKCRAHRCTAAGRPAAPG